MPYKAVSTFLAGSKIATAADLAAATQDLLNDLRLHLRHGATDAFKSFWNEDQHGKPLHPKSENSCRDRLLDLIDHRARVMGIAVEREGSMAESKRCDIKAIEANYRIPIEIKTAFHRKLWSALDLQLRAMYARDPAAGGNGIYVVLWFGNVPGRAIPIPPKGIGTPRSGPELEDCLRNQIPSDFRQCLEVLVFDVSKPNLVRALKQRKKRIRSKRQRRISGASSD